MNKNRGFIGIAALIILALLILGGGYYAVTKMQGTPGSFPVDQLPALETGDSTTSAAGQMQASDEELPLLAFTSPQSGAQVNAVQGTSIAWRLTDETLLQTFPDADTYIGLHLISADGTDVGSIGDGLTINKTSTFWPIASYLNQNFYKLTEGTQYKIRATLSYEPNDFTCDPAKPNGSQECVPVYSQAEQVIRNKAKQYQSDSGWFTVDLSGYVHPIGTIDPGSALSGTATGLSQVNLQIWMSNTKTAPTITSVVVPVTNGRWSYVPSPSLPSGDYEVNVWSPDGNTSLASGTFTISSPVTPSIPGMSKETYNDPDSGFNYSFWYPTGSFIKSNQNPVTLADKQLNVNGVIIQPVNFPDGTVTTPQGGCMAKYFFDATSGKWMQTISGCDSPTTTTVYDTSGNTMGGLPVFFSQNGLSSQSYIVPLSATSAQKALQISGPYSVLLPLVKTITATNPSAATPVSASAQQAIIHAEATAYAQQ